MNFRGLKIRIENPAGSIRSGVDRVTGKPWSVRMTHDYGEIMGTNGVDGDPVDCFLGPNKNAPFVFVVHQLQKHTGEFDEDKCFLGFNDTMDAKAAYYKNYDNADLFYGSIEAVPFNMFKKQAFSNGGDTMIHGAWDGISVTVGDPVTVDGMRGRGVVVEDNGDDVVVRFRNGEHIKRKKYNVHNMGDNTYHSRYQTVQAGGPGSGCHGSNCGRKPKFSKGDQVRHVDPVERKNDPRILTVLGNTKSTKGTWLVKVPGGYGEALIPEHKLEKIQFDKGLNKWKSDEKEHEMARKNPKQRKLPLKAKQEDVEMERGPITVPHGPNKRIEKVGSLFCVISDGVDRNFGCYGSREQAEAVMAGRSFIEPDIPAGMYAGGPGSGPRPKDEQDGEWPVARYGEKKPAPWEDIQFAVSNYPNTGWIHKPPTTPHPRPQIAKPARRHNHPPRTLPKPPAVTHVTHYAAPHIAKAPGIKKPKGAHKTLESFGDLGEPMAGALGHMHIEPESWFHPPSLENRNKADHTPTDDPGEKDNKFLDVTKRKQAHKDRMKLLKRGAPGGLPPYIPAQTTGIAPHMAMSMAAKLKFKKNKGLIDVINPRTSSLRVPHTISYVPGVRANMDERGIFVSYARRGCL
jgi:Inorganic Pyrophosphatase